MSPADRGKGRDDNQHGPAGRNRCPWSPLLEIQVHDAQCEAERQLGRSLTDAELDRIAKDLEQLVADDLAALVGSLSDPV